MSEKAVKAVSMLVDRIRLTSFGLMLNVANLNSRSVADFLRRHPDVMSQVDLWLEDVMKMMEKKQ
jgi:hypothetical protein